MPRSAVTRPLAVLALAAVLAGCGGGGGGVHKSDVAARLSKDQGMPSKVADCWAAWYVKHADKGSLKKYVDGKIAFKDIKAPGDMRSTAQRSRDINQCERG